MLTVILVILIITNVVFLGIAIYFYLRYREAFKFYQRQVEIIKERGTLPRELKDKRTFPRVPGLTEKPLKLKFKSPPLKDFVGVVDNISMGGVAILPKFPISRVKLDQDVNDIEIIFPDGAYPVNSAKVVRIAHLGSERIIAFKWLEMPGRTRERIKAYINEHRNN
ncbi:MAG: PilZ domain-containing protein [Candidatus Aminicenantes bacterium]|nr:PilZ domain-containing protein [Candidatus Aminicenantes bacterium]